MSVREFTKSGTFVAVVFALVVVLLPFGLEEIGETTGLFKFPVRKTISGWFSPPAAEKRGGDTFKPVDWERYRHDLEEFTKWADERRIVMIKLPTEPIVIRVVEEVEKPKRRMWPVPVSGCTAGNPVTGTKGYVFISNCENMFREGSVLKPTEELCGYEIVSVGERTVWFRAVFNDDDSPMGIMRFPEFTRVDGERLVLGRSEYVAGDAFQLPSGGWLKLESFMPPDGTVFKILDERKRVVATILCKVIGEKGGK